MKVLIIDVNCEYSSTGKIAYGLYKGAKEDGYEARIAYGRGPEIDDPYAYKFGIDFETYAHAFLARLTGKNGCYSKFSTDRLIRYIEEFQPDIVHIHELHAYFVNISQLLSYLKKRQIPVVWTFHCEYMYTGKCGFAFECSNYKSGCGNCPQVREYVKSFALDRSKELLSEKKKAIDGLNLKYIVSPSEWLADRTKETYLGKYNIKVIHNGIDTKGIFYPRQDVHLKEKYNIAPDKKMVLAVAPNILEERKGGNTVIELSKIMPEVFFVLIGADETKKYSDNVLLVQRTRNQDELAQWYSEADVFIICSTAENFPTTPIEAMCCGTPVLGLDLGGTKETAAEPYGTFIKPDGANTINLLKEALKIKLNHSLSTEEVSKYARDNYDNEVMYKNYANLYHDIISGQQENR